MFTGLGPIRVKNNPNQEWPPLGDHSSFWRVWSAVYFAGGVFNNGPVPSWLRGPVPSRSPNPPPWPRPRPPREPMPIPGPRPVPGVGVTAAGCLTSGQVPSCARGPVPSCGPNPAPRPRPAPRGTPLTHKPPACSIRSSRFFSSAVRVPLSRLVRRSLRVVWT